jgi:hypothetical protein
MKTGCLNCRQFEAAVIIISQFCISNSTGVQYDDLSIKIYTHIYFDGIDSAVPLLNQRNDCYTPGMILEKRKQVTDSLVPVFGRVYRARMLCPQQDVQLKERKGCRAGCQSLVWLCYSDTCLPLEGKDSVGETKIGCYCVKGSDVCIPSVVGYEQNYWGRLRYYSENDGITYLFEISIDSLR